MKKMLVVLGLTIVIAACAATAVADDNPSPQPNQLTNFRKMEGYVNAFRDIDGHWAREYIVNAGQYGIINGIGGGLYHPEGRLTVAQAITIAARLHMVYKYADAGQSVMDGYAASAAPGHWAAPFVAYAVNEKLIDDSWGGTLDKPVTRAETIRIWSGVLQPKDLAGINTVNSLPDVDLSTPDFAEIARFYEAGIVQGSTIDGVPNSFRPDETLSRAEAAAICVMLTDTQRRISGKEYGDKSVSTVAGTGTSGFTDDQPALASFTLPHGLTASPNGGIVVFDTYNNALRLIHNGEVGTLAGQWIAQDSNRFSRGYYRDGTLSETLFNRPTDGVYGGGDLFVCDSENHVIRVIKDGRSYTFAGTTQGYADGAGNVAKFDTPMAVAIDEKGNLYVADTMNHCIRMISAQGDVTTVAGVPGQSGDKDGNAEDALFYAPSGIAVNEDGSEIFIADTGNHKIRKWENGRVTTLSGVIAETDEDGDPTGDYQDGAAGEAMFNLPKGLALAGDVLFVADSGNNLIRAVNKDGHAFTAAGTGEPGDREGGALTAAFSQPAGILWHEGMLYIADTTNNIIKVLKIDITLFRESPLPS